MWTAVLAIIFGVGLIIGQRMLLEDNLRPLVSSGENTPSLSAITKPSQPAEEASEGADFFSFYDALTTSDVDDIGASIAIDTPRGAEVEGETGQQEGVEDGDPDDHAQRAAEIDDDEQPQTDDGSEPARYTLQIASHPTMERARTEMDRLRALELDPHVVAADVPDQGKHYRVRIGKFPSEDEARAYRGQVESDHDVQTFVTPL